MAKIILNKNAENEVIIAVDNIFERIIDKRLNATKTIKTGQPIVIPEIDDVYFDTLNIETDEGANLPYACTYNHIDEFSTAYYSEDDQFTYTIVLGYGE